MRQHQSTSKIKLIAALSHLVDFDFESDIISIQTLEKAIRVGEVLTEHALKAFVEARVDEDDQLVKDVFDWILNMKQNYFVKKDLTVAFKDRTKVDRLEKVLKTLISRDIISRPVKESTKRLKYLVNPAVLSE